MTVIKKSTVEINNPGSYSDYVKAHEIEDGSNAPEKYSEALKRYRLVLAAQLGIALEDLHDMKFHCEDTAA